MSQKNISPQPPLRLSLFTPQDYPVVQEAMQWLHEQRPSLYHSLRDSEVRLNRLSRLVSQYPSLLASEDLSPIHQDIDTLIDDLCHLDPMELKLRLPSKAVLGEAYLLNKAQHFTAILLSGKKADPSLPRALRRGLIREISNVLHTYLLHQLLLDVILNKAVERDIKRRAAWHLLCLWETCEGPEAFADFFALIRSIWDARIHLKVQYGTLLGTSELVQLIAAQCDPEVLDYFTNRAGHQRERWAFKEFLFGLSFEEMSRLRQCMRERNIAVVGCEEVARLLGTTVEDLHTEPEDPHIVYRSYKRRRLQARYRAATNADGPWKTAEEYLLLYLLRKRYEPQTDSDSLAEQNSQCHPSALSSPG